MIGFGNNAVGVARVARIAPRGRHIQAFQASAPASAVLCQAFRLAFATGFLARPPLGFVADVTFIVEVFGLASALKRGASLAAGPFAAALAGAFLAGLPRPPAGRPSRSSMRSMASPS